MEEPSILLIYPESIPRWSKPGFERLVLSSFCNKWLPLDNVPMSGLVLSPHLWWQRKLHFQREEPHSQPHPRLGHTNPSCWMTSGCAFSKHLVRLTVSSPLPVIIEYNFWNSLSNRCNMYENCSYYTSRECSYFNQFK